MVGVEDADFRSRRKKGDENQLTREIRRLCAADNRLAVGFTETLISVARLVAARAEGPAACHPQTGDG